MGCTNSRDSSQPCATDTEGKLGPQSLVAYRNMVNVVTDRDIHDAYDFTGPVLGKGSFATVLRVRDRMSGSEYAVKQIDLESMKHSPGSLDMIDREIRTMMALSHPNIVRLQEVYRPVSEDMLYMVLDRLEGGSVDGLWREQGKLSEDHAAHIILQIVSAVRYCHDRGIAHRDLKMENSIFEDASLVPIVKVIDFGLCAELKSGVSSRAFVGTVLYSAPEILKVDGHGLACDLWSIGVMAYALIGGEFPWYSQSSEVCGQMIKYTDLKFPPEKWKNVSPLCRTFIERCLVKNPKKRITAQEAQQHPWLRKAARAMEGAPLSKGAMMAMLNYQNGNSFKRIVMELVAYSYEPSQMKDLELEFLRMDKRGEGQISMQEFKDVLLERWNELESSSSTRGQLSRRNSSKISVSSSATPSGPKRNASPTADGGGGGRATGSEAPELANGSNSNTSVNTSFCRPATSAGSGHVAKTGSQHQPPAAPAQPSDADGGVDHIALNAALLAVQADSNLSRKALKRMLSARQRRPLDEDSGPQLDSGSAQGGRTPRVRELSVRTLNVEPERRRTRSMDERKAEEIFRSMDCDHSGKIDFTEFVAGCLVEKQVGEAALRTAFDRLDHSRSGLISLGDVEMYLGEDFEEEEMSRNMRAISTREDGQVSYNDFKKCLLGGALPNSKAVTPALSRSASFKALSKLVSSAEGEKSPAGEGSGSVMLEAEEEAVVATAAMATAGVLGSIPSQVATSAGHAERSCPSDPRTPQ